MAPELRKRKSSTKVADKAVPSKVEKTTVVKRKATEDDSPIAKKQKSVKTEKKPVKGISNGATQRQATKKTGKSADGLLKSKVVASESKAKLLTEGKPSDAEESEEELDEQTQALVRTLDDSDDGAGVDESAAYMPGQDVGKVPKISNKAKKALPQAEREGSGVVLISRIPHGFYEHQMRQYFSQFGDIVRLRLSRNKRTAASRHYGFIEFKEPEVAAIVSRAMNAYLLFGSILKVQVVAQSQIHPDLWKGANARFKKIPWNKMAGNQLKKPLTESGWAERVSKEERKREARAQKLKDMGYEFESPRLTAPSEVVRALPGPEGETKESTKAVETAPAAEVVEQAVAVVQEGPTEADEVVTATKVKGSGKKAKGTKVKKIKS